LATRLSGSSDLYEQSGRLPHASINFITCHDGFTLQDLVSYNQKHNEANSENNRDGSDDNLSWNCGAEGPTNDPAIRALRERQKRNLIASLLLSQGVPMIRGGDELSHTQNGNNNAYCQDNETTWLNWELSKEQQQFLDFVRMVTSIWRQQPVFQRRKFFLGRKIRGSDIKDISWFDPSGQEMSDEAWEAGFVRCLGVRLAGDLIGDVDERGEPVVGETLLVLLNAHHEPIPFTLPATKIEHHWECLYDTASEKADPLAYPGGQKYALQGRSLAVLRTRVPEEMGQAISLAEVETLRREARSVPQPASHATLSSVR
jgi:glycogen operon protein